LVAGVQEFLTCRGGGSTCAEGAQNDPPYGDVAGRGGFHIERLRREPFVSALRVKDAQGLGRPPAGIFVAK
jgi:hypothetical protein